VAFGPAGWWPAQTPFEVCLGAILVQNTAWPNVERALAGLRARGLLEPAALASLPQAELAELLRPAGTFNVKARRVRAWLEFLHQDFGGRVENLAGVPLGELRPRLLQVHGLGPESADAILLYAVGHPVFVVDAYTTRIFARLGLARRQAGYDELQAFITSRLPEDAGLFNDYHAQLVRLAKEHCRVRPRCATCPLEGVCLRRGVPMR